MKTLERAFGITLTAEESARCTSAEETTAVFAARLGALPGVGNLRAGALAAVREALREVARADRESVGEATPLAPHFPRWNRARRWRSLARELQFKLPPVRATWVAVAVAAPILAAHAVFIRGYPSDRVVEEPTMVRLVVLAFVGVLGVLGFAVSLDLPERVTTVEKLVTWLVAQRPSAYRGGTEWTTGQVGETVDAVHRLRFFRPGCRRSLRRDALVALLVVAMIGTTLALCLLGLASQVRTVYLFPR